MTDEEEDPCSVVPTFTEGRYQRDGCLYGCHYDCDCECNLKHCLCHYREVR